MWRSFMVLLMFVLGKNLCQDVESACVLGKRTYRDGETWNPVLKSTVSICVNCTCNGGTISCNKKQCPSPKCSEPIISPDVCCPFCEVEPDEPNSQDNEEALECNFDGRTYASGEVFSSNSTGISPNDEKNQCINCVCTRGDVLCHLKTCNIPKKCKKLINSNDSCCPKCADNLNSSYDAIDSGLGDQTDNDCTDTQGVIHRNGSEWRPAVSNCVTCSCINGEIDCRKLKCPPADSLSCKNPRRRGSDCCKSCRKRKKVCLRDMRRRTKRRNKNRNSRRRGKNKGRKSKKQKSNDPATENMELPPLRENVNINNLQIPDFFEDMCMSRKTNIIVYHHVEGRIMFLAFDDPKQHQVEVWRWRLKKRVCGENQNAQDGCKSRAADVKLSSLEKFTFPVDQFRKQATQTMVIGATSKKHVKKLKRKLSRTMTKCNKKSKCRVKHVTRAMKKGFRNSPVSYNCKCRKS